MRNVYVSLPTPETVQSFVETLSGLEGDFDLISGKYILDARSLMGIFTFDLSHPIRLKIYDDNETTLRALGPYIVQGPEGPPA